MTPVDSHASAGGLFGSVFQRMLDDGANQGYSMAALGPFSFCRWTRTPLHNPVIPCDAPR